MIAIKSILRHTFYILKLSNNNNQKAPSFNVKDVFGREINLDIYKNDSDYILLTFLRYAGCPLCNLAIYRLSLEQKRLSEYNCQVIAFVQSDKTNIINNIYNRHIPKPTFPIIADHEMHVYKKYDVKISPIETVKSAITDVPYWLEAIRKRGFKQKNIDGNLFLVPAWFLINSKNGNIIKKGKNTSFYQHESFVAIFNSLIFKD